MMRDVDQVEEVLRANLVRKTKSSGNPERTLRRSFNQLDINGDDKVSLLEFRKVLEPFVTGAPDDLVEQLFARWDSDGSGDLDVEEFVSALFKDPEERAKMSEAKREETAQRRASSVKSDDIIEQARLRRQERKNKQRGPQLQKVDLSNSKGGIDPRQEDTLPSHVNRGRAGSSHNSSSKNKIDDSNSTDHLAKPVRGPLRADTSEMPISIRYRVSSSWVTAHPPSDLNGKAAVRRSSQVPEESLELEFVYGTNPKARMFSRPNGEAVYAAAGLGVVYNPRTHKQRFFKGHDDDVTCVALDASGKFAATGCMGKAPVVHVWDTDTMECVGTTEVDFYERRITAVAFSPSNPKILVAIGGDNHHMLGVWNWATGQLLAQAATQNGTPPQIHQLVFDDENKCEEGTRFVTVGFKHVKFWTFDEATKSLCGGKNATYGKVSPQPRETRCAAFLPGDNAVTGGSNGVLYLWDAAKTQCKRAFPAHDGPVLAVLVAADHQFISAGAKDKSLTYWATENIAQGSGTMKKQEQVALPTACGPAYSLAFMSRGKAQPVLLLATKDGSLQAFSRHSDPNWKTLIGGHFEDLYGVAVHPVHPSAFCTVGEDHLLNVWDADSRQLVSSIELPGQGRSVDIASNNKHVAIGFKDGSFCVLQSPTFEIVFKGKHCQETIDDIRFSPDASLLAVASHDNFIDVYEVDRGFKHLTRCRGHTSYVTHIDWSEDSFLLQSNCGAYEALVWNARTGKLVTQASKTRDVAWATSTCVLGFPVMGIWPHGADGTDINAVSRSPDDALLATGDDSGNVNLFNYPCIVEHAGRRTSTGHSSHVMNLRWTADASRLLSVGGCDRSVFQWRRDNGSSSAKAFSASSPSHLLQASRPWKPPTSWK